jgi:hypothetical protein
VTAETTEEPRGWVFTFGAEIPALEHRYVTIYGTWLDARQRMLSLYGRRWCAQYESAEDAGVDRYHLTELILPPTALGDHR